jgi:hypothetical protein
MLSCFDELQSLEDHKDVMRSSSVACLIRVRQSSCQGLDGKVFAYSGAKVADASRAETIPEGARWCLALII